MTKSTKVASFLAVTDKCFDPTLMFVMAGAILVNLPVFQAIIRKKVFPAKPVCALEYQMPKKHPLYIAFMASMLAGFALESSSFGQAIWKKPAQA
eukprot:jgi/Tetstr1/432072/TSEL_021543.t1